LLFYLLLGFQNLQTAQDIAQDTLLQALHTWSYKGAPDNPAAWLYRVAKNKAIDYWRREKIFRGVRLQHAYLLQSEYTLNPTVHLLQLSERSVSTFTVRKMRNIITGKPCR